MNENDHDSVADVSEIENTLRQLTPTSLSNLETEETFYRAGWNAAVAARQSGHEKSSEPARKQSHVGFAYGIVVGLVMSAAVVTRWPSGATETKAPVVNLPLESEARNVAESVPEPLIVATTNELALPAQDVHASLTVADSRRWDDLSTNEFATIQYHSRTRRAHAERNRGRPAVRSSSIADWPELRLL